MKYVHGIILDNKGSIINYSSIPTFFERGDNVIVIKESELKEVVNSKLKLLLAHSYPMPQIHWDPNLTNLFPNCNQCLHMADEIFFIAGDGTENRTEHRLVLERKLYSHNPRDYLFIRYVSVDQAEDEGELPARVEDVIPNPLLKDHPNMRDSPGQQYLF